MCDPVSAAVVGTALAGSSWAAYNQSKSYNRNLVAQDQAKKKAFNAAMERQDGYADEAQKRFDPLVNSQSAESYAKSMSDGRDNRLELFANSLANDNGNYTFAPNAPKNVKLYGQKVFGESDQKALDRAGSLADLGGYSDANLKLGLDRDEYLRAFGNLSDKASRDSRLLGLELEGAANNAYKSPSQSLSILGSGAKLLGMYGAAGTPGTPKPQ